VNGAKRNAYRILVGKPEEERPLGGPRHRWEDNTLRWIEIYDGVIWTDLAQDRDKWKAREHGNGPLGSIKFLSSYATGSSMELDTFEGNCI
jgi:hypothetical protein